MGLTIIHIFGFDTRSALPLAEKCGVAFQLTNILRDIREDAERGRIYLPAEDLRRFGVSADDLRAGQRNGPFERLMAFEAERARAYYNESRPLLDLIHPRSRKSLWALIAIYSRLLERIEQSGFDVFRAASRLAAVGEIVDCVAGAGYSMIRLICRGSGAGCLGRAGLRRSSWRGSNLRINWLSLRDASQMSNSRVQRAQAPPMAPRPSTAGL